MHASTRTFVLLASVALPLVAAACSDPSGPNGSPSAAAPALAKGTGGGGTAVPTPPPSTATPTVAISSTLFPGVGALVGQQVAVYVTATSESGNRKAPALTLVTAPAGFTLLSTAVVNSPDGGGPGYTTAQYAWTPTRDQIGLPGVVTVTATTSGGSASGSITLGPVQDAPSALTGLTALAVVDHIEARWDPSSGGVAPISYVVRACYRNENIRETAATCDLVATTTDSQALDIPLVNPTPSVAPAGGVATYFLVMVTPVDAAGHAGPLASANVQ